MKTENENKAGRYFDLPYTVMLRRDREGDWVAKIDELQGCSAHGSTQAEALANLEEAKRLWIEDAIDSGSQIPLPAEEEELPSGKWLQRTPRSLHKKLSDTAKREGVSLNQLVSAILAEAVGLRQVHSEIAQSSSIVQPHRPSCRVLWSHFEKQSWNEWEIDQPLWRGGRIADALSTAFSAIPDNTETKVVASRVGKKAHAYNA
jgi:antitoxin HicB